MDCHFGTDMSGATDLSHCSMLRLNPPKCLLLPSKCKHANLRWLNISILASAIASHFESAHTQQDIDQLELHFNF